MAGDEGTASKAAAAAAPRPPIAVPSLFAVENLFVRGINKSPGPLTIISSLFPENDAETECHSFSQLLAGTVVNPAAFPRMEVSRGANTTEKFSGERQSNGGILEFKQSRPLNLIIPRSPLLTIPPGLSPSSLLDSPGVFSPGQGPFTMSHQQVLAQVTAQAVQSHPLMKGGYPLPSGSAPAASGNVLSLQQLSSQTSESTTTTAGSLEQSISHHASQSLGSTVERPAEDGYNWRKYGQKQVKGSEYPRSYYKCTNPNCPVKKKIERSFDGHVTEIIYKGQHNHQKPQALRRTGESGSLPLRSMELCRNMGINNVSDGTANALITSVTQQEQVSGHVITEWVSNSSECEDVGYAEVCFHGEDENEEPDLKKRNADTMQALTRIDQAVVPHKMMMEPKVIVQTTSEVDLLDDGYKWRKYGQKVVKGNPYPRSYYKCTSSGCGVRKHVERGSTDPKAVITTYEGKHNHDVPSGKNSSHSTLKDCSELKATNGMDHEKASTSVKFQNCSQQSVPVVMLKQEVDIT